MEGMGSPGRRLPGALGCLARRRVGVGGSCGWDSPKAAGSGHVPLYRFASGWAGGDCPGGPRYGQRGMRCGGCRGVFHPKRGAKRKRARWWALPLPRRLPGLGRVFGGQQDGGLPGWSDWGGGRVRGLGDWRGGPGRSPSNVCRVGWPARWYPAYPPPASQRSPPARRRRLEFIGLGDREWPHGGGSLTAPPPLGGGGGAGLEGPGGYGA